MIKDKVVIITGASSGIGYATAMALSKAGAKVAIGARRTEKLADLESKIKENVQKYLLIKVLTKIVQPLNFLKNFLKALCLPMPPSLTTPLSPNFLALI